MGALFTLFVYSLAVVDAVFTWSVLQEIAFYYYKGRRRDYGSLDNSDLGSIPMIDSAFQYAPKLCSLFSRNPKALKFVERVLYRSFYVLAFIGNCLYDIGYTVLLLSTGRYQAIPNEIQSVGRVYNEWKRAQRAEEWNASTKTIAKLDKKIRRTKEILAKPGSRVLTPLENGINPIGSTCCSRPEDRRIVCQKLERALRQVVEQNRRLEEPQHLMHTGECLKCQGAPRSHFFRSCCHLALCSDCAADAGTCPICKTRSDVAKAFLE